MDAFCDQRFAAGEDAVLGGMGFNLFQYFVQGHLFPLGFPRGVHRVAPIASQVATGSADKNGWDARKLSFTLNGVEYLRNEHLMFGPRAMV